MNITLTSMQAHSLAEQFAKVILGRVHSQHLALVDPHFRGTDRLMPVDLSFDEMKSAIRSIADRYERRAFVGAIRFHFDLLRKERDTDIRGRDYVARVENYRRQQEAQAA